MGLGLRGLLTFVLFDKLALIHPVWADCSLAVYKSSASQRHFTTKLYWTFPTEHRAITAGGEAITN